MFFMPKGSKKVTFSDTLTEMSTLTQWAPCTQSLKSLVSSACYRAHHGWNWRENVIIKVICRLENTILIHVFANTVYVLIIHSFNCCTSTM